jgi:hypothetical protein
MPVTQEKPAPYAPTSVILSLLDRHRQRGLPTPITPEVLSRAGVTDSLNSRTLQAMQVLDLIDEDGKPTPVFEGLRLAPEAQYKERMAQWLTDAYADALSFVDPATASDTEIRDAFRGYKPTGMQDRMVTLFIGLCEAAGLSPERKRRASTSNGPRKVAAPNTTKRMRTDADATKAGNATNYHHGKTLGLPPALSGLLASLPTDGTWTKPDRDRFVETFKAVLDFCYPVTTAARQKVQFLEEENVDDT